MKCKIVNSYLESKVEERWAAWALSATGGFDGQVRFINVGSDSILHDAIRGRGCIVVVPFA